MTAASRNGYVGYRGVGSVGHLALDGVAIFSHGGAISISGPRAVNDIALNPISRTASAVIGTVGAAPPIVWGIDLTVVYSPCAITIAGNVGAVGHRQRGLAAAAVKSHRVVDKDSATNGFATIGRVIRDCSPISNRYIALNGLSGGIAPPHIWPQMITPPVVGS